MPGRAQHHRAASAPAQTCSILSGMMPAILAAHTTSPCLLRKLVLLQQALVLDSHNPASESPLTVSSSSAAPVAPDGPPTRRSQWPCAWLPAHRPRPPP